MDHQFGDDIAAAVERLRAARRAISREIAGYPTPISGCDAQFNHLLSEREKVRRALEALGSQPFVATPRVPAPGARVESR